MQHHEKQLGPTKQKALLWFLLRAIKSMWWEHSWTGSWKLIRSHTIEKRCTWCYCRVCTAPPPLLELQVEFNRKSKLPLLNPSGLPLYLSFQYGCLFIIPVTHETIKKTFLAGFTGITRIVKDLPGCPSTAFNNKSHGLWLILAHDNSKAIAHETV